MDLDKAHKILNESGLICHRGIIIKPLEFIETEEQTKAFNYLCAEWDYSVMPSPYPCYKNNKEV